LNKPLIGIVISSTRENRFGEKAARWIHDIAARRSDLDFEMIDLRDYPLPFFDAKSPSYFPVTNAEALRWGGKMAELDGYLFVTAEYNRSITGVLKNALDWAYHEYGRKPAAYVGYGTLGGARAVEQLRLINVELKMAPLRSGVHIAGADFIGLLMHGKSFDEMPHLAQSAVAMLDELAWWTTALKAARELEVRRAA
jgi:NAD(P)H-dependent FMN reductase